MIEKEMTDEVLEARYWEILEEMSTIKGQIDRAKAEAAANKSYSDMDWFHRANHALRARKIEHQRVTVERAKRSRDARQTKDVSADRRFIEAAKRILSRDLFMEIVADSNHSDAQMKADGSTQYRNA